jgi:hypothetical protein
LPLALLWLAIAAPQSIKLIGLCLLYIARHPASAATQVRVLGDQARERHALRLRIARAKTAKPALYKPGDL